MKNCFLNLVLIVWQASIVLPCGSAQASNCSTGCLSCDILKDGSKNSSLTICISPIGNTNCNHYYQDRTLEKGRILTFRCTWMQRLMDDAFEWNLYGPEGWKVLLRVQSSRNLQVEAGDIHIDDTTDTDGVSSGSGEDTNSNFDSVEDRYFNNTDQFLSKTNMIWIRASFFPDREVRRSTSPHREVFDIITRTANVTDSVDTQFAKCAIGQMHSWGMQGYIGNNEESNGSLSIHCNKSLPQQETLISFFYNITIIINSEFPDSNDGLIQLVYTGEQNLIMNNEPNLNVTYDLSQCDSFWIRFDASGMMELNIYNVAVQGLIYDDDDIEPACMSSSPSNPPTTSLIYIAGEGTTSFTPANMTSWISETVTMTTERTAADSMPISLIPIVAGVASFVLVFLVVLCICLRKRCHKNQSRGRESAQLDDFASLNNEQHEYCEVRPSVKSPPYTTLSGVTDQSVGQKNYAFVVTGPAMVVAETVHSDDKTAEVSPPTANKKVLSDGPVYTLVDMDKKALDREEKANNARYRGHAYSSNINELDFIPLDEYETVTVSPPVSPGASASLRPDSYPLSEYETVSPPMSPVAMAPELERPYDTLQRGPVSRKQTATSSTVDKKAKEEANHDDALNVYNELATPGVALHDSEEGSEAYQHLQRPLSKRPKAGASLPEIPDEGYGRLDLGGSGASNQTDPVTHHAQDSQGPKTTQVDPMYAILEKPAEANVPDDDDPEYDLLDACV